MAENDQLKRDIEDIFNDIKDPIRKMQERIWFRNILYYMGEQYIDWIISEQTFRRRQMNPLQPTPVANVVRDFVRAKKALYLNRTYGIRVWPNSNDQNDRDAAKLGELYLQSADLDNEEAFADEQDDLLDILIIMGTAFMRTFPYKSGSMFGMDYNGKIIEMGDVGNQLVLPFNVYPDLFGRKLRYHRYVGVKSLKPVEWVQDQFGIKVETSGDDAQTTNYEKRLMKLVSEASPWKGAGLMTSQLLDMKAEKLCVFKEIEFAPTKAYPDGRYAIMANHELVGKVVDHLPIPVKNNKWYYTLTDFHYNKVIGRFWADGGVNDLISPQNSINEIDKSLEMNRKGLGRPILWWPEGSAMERMNKGDLSFMAIKYNPLLSGGQKPEIDRGAALPNQILDERSVHKETIQESSGDPKNILRGKAPTAKASGVMVDILSEKAEAGHLPDIKSYFRSMKQVYKKRLILAQEIFSEDRLLKIAGQGSRIYVKNFKGSDLRSNHDVRLEMDTSSATSQASKTETILKMFEAGFFTQDLGLDPQTKADIMKRLGLGNFNDKNNPHVERAERENAAIANDDVDNILLMLSDENENGEPEGEPKVANPDDIFPFDNHAIHLAVHGEYIISPEFQDMIEPQQVVLLNHTMAHKQAVGKEQEQAMVQQAFADGKLQPEGQGEQR